MVRWADAHEGQAGGFRRQAREGFGGGGALQGQQRAILVHGEGDACGLEICLQVGDVGVARGRR